MPLFKGVKEQITVRVIVELLTDRNTIEQVKFRATFKKLKAAQCDELAKREMSQDVDMAEIVRENIVGWDGVEDADGEPVAFDDEAVNDILEYVEYRSALYEAFSRGQFSRKATNSKN